ncbi:uncharacterized protein MYCFIDRAFT_195757 [Pseudocercospora fijiensis CIRAD86]|uniref:Uncharacterized protein n=1 Tax=Pseudocercospora fijiensis (strain CIRAD86) TaxID=383855 RepID=M3B646_PSEFD|nr:uncharacterized protein MYCFIDRAFT_195757 [Pseudocercospora fijiensis CIRAD86]EME84803.1 hypothetical protein MYCFIDRAFT_195757 [Pseudocercospora fijiensis CIRAD86]
MPLFPRRGLVPAQRLYALHQRRTFLGLQRTPAPSPKQMRLLVLQGLGVVLLADLAIATAQGEPTTVRSVAQSAGFWKQPPPLHHAHHARDDRHMLQADHAVGGTTVKTNPLRNSVG